MKILINASNLGPGGATQVADSLCCSLNQFPEFSFVVVLTPQMNGIAKAIANFKNVKVVFYQIMNNWKTYLLARDAFLDNLVVSEQIDIVFSVFAPTWWKPRCPHLCGFALAHLVMPESPFFKSLSLKDRIKQKIQSLFLTFFYKRSSRYYYTENQLISDRVGNLLHCKKVYTVTNYYNQIFDQPQKQKYHQLPAFQGVTLLTVSSSYPHKNLTISIKIAEILKKSYPDFRIRFVFTIDEKQFQQIPDELKAYFCFIGRVDISECPSLYEQCTFEFQPTLLECFTATYPEAMRMGRPIITTDLEFAKSLCGDAAIYYDPLSAKDAANKIYSLVSDKTKQEKLVQNGFKQLKQFDTYNDRAKKLVQLCVEVYTECTVKS